MVTQSRLVLEKCLQPGIQQECLTHQASRVLFHARMAKLSLRVMAKHLPVLMALPSRRAARDRACLSDQVRRAQLPLEQRSLRVERLARRQPPLDRVPPVELAAEYSLGFQS
jgi:hypothetical protein